MTREEPQFLLVRARGGPSPLYEPEVSWAEAHPDAFTRDVPLDDDRPALPGELADALRSWALSRPADNVASRPGLRRHAAQGLALARRLARHLGPSWAVCYWDEGRRTTKWLCWGCDRLHWERDSHGTPPHPVDITVEGEFKYGPLRSDGFGDFLPDDPAAALDLSEGLVADLYAWAKDIDDALNRYVRDREDGRYGAECERLFRTGSALAQRLAHELGPSRTVTYKGLANGGLAAITSVSWRGDRQL
ncbi:hypothetical protein ACFV2H_20820 [Streptomyces sp. NPDC059629]|uniref:hypothetical protein n=1 Tax=Streptomyces sp. NPDC059629 TaxID=3346889 RepID=UPI00368290B3